MLGILVKDKKEIRVTSTLILNEYIESRISC